MTKGSTDESGNSSLGRKFQLADLHSSTRWETGNTWATLYVFLRQTALSKAAKANQAVGGTVSAFLLYHPITRPTGRQLREELGIPGGTRVRGTPTVLIRWGSRRLLEGPQDPELEVVNRRHAVELASDKLRTLERLQQAGVRVPEFVVFPGPLDRYLEGTWLGRRRRGYGGQDILVSHNGTPMGYGRSQFATRYVPNRREYRIHVFNGEVIRVQGKYLDFPEQHTNPYVKNYAQGFRFRTPSLTLHSSRIEAAINAVAALGLVFGAVDLLIGEDGLEYVLEVNTAPKLAPLTCKQYADAIRGYLSTEYGVTNA